MNPLVWGKVSEWMDMKDSPKSSYMCSKKQVFRTAFSVAPLTLNCWVESTGRIVSYRIVSYHQQNRIYIGSRRALGFHSSIWIYTLCSSLSIHGI